MNSTTRSVFRVGVLTIGSLLGIGAGRAQAQTPSYYYPAPWSCYPAPVYSSPAPRFVFPAPLYSSPAPRYVSPAPMYSSPAPVYSSPPRAATPWAQRSAYLSPAPAYPAPIRDDSELGRSYSYFDADNVEHDSRYPHWTFDYNLRV